MPGDCGAWVLDRQNGDVFGMIVATSSDLQESYCLPISTIFDGIIALRPNGTGISFPGAVSQARGNLQPHHSLSPRLVLCQPLQAGVVNDSSISTNNLEPKESSDHANVAQESADPTSHTTSAELGDHESDHEPPAVSEQSLSDASDQASSEPAKEPHVWETHEDATGVPELEPTAEANAKHSQPAPSGWARAETQEFPIAALDSLGVLWRKVEGAEDYILVNREVTMAIRNARAEPQSANVEGPLSDAKGTRTEDLDTKARHADIDSPTKPLPPFDVNSSPPHSPQAESQSRPEVVVNREPAVTSEPGLLADQGKSSRGDDAEKQQRRTRRQDDEGSVNYVVGDQSFEIDYGPTHDKIVMPPVLVEDRALHALGYAFYVQV